MKALVVLLAGALIVGPAPALERDGRTLTLDDAEKTQCAAEGGCIVITATRLASELEKFRAKTLRECKGAT